MKGTILTKDKGITLIALIISIIILLILTTVTITQLTNNGIIGKARGAVSNYSEAEFLEKVNLGIADAGISKYVTNVNYVTVVNKILKNLKYPQMNDAGSQLADEGDRTNYNGKITITAGSDYSYPESRNFKIAWDQTNNKIIIWRTDDNGEQKKYIWNNLIYAGVENLIVEGNSADWIYTIASDGILTITGYKGNIEKLEKAEDGKINLTIPNVIIEDTGNKQKVNQISIGLNKEITGTVTVSSGLEVKRLIANSHKVILKDNIIADTWGWLNSIVETLEVGYGCSLGTPAEVNNLKNVTLSSGTKIQWSTFYSAKKLTKESVDGIIANANILSGTAFGNLTFEEPVDIVIPSGKTINVTLFGKNCTGINSITVEDNCQITSGIADKIVLNKLNIGNNCSIKSNGFNLTTTEFTIGNGCIISSLGSVTLSDDGNKEIQFGDDCKMYPTALNNVKNLSKLKIGNNFTKPDDASLDYIEVHNGFLSNPTLETLEIGNNANIKGKLLHWANYDNVKTIIIGSESVFANGYSAFPGLSEECNLTFGAGTTIISNTFGTTTAPASVRLYLTSEQKLGEAIQPEWDVALVTKLKMTKDTSNPNYILWTKTN